jgi:alkyl hydroperoxide reductase subunit AhpC
VPSDAVRNVGPGPSSRPGCSSQTRERHRIVENQFGKDIEETQATPVTYPLIGDPQLNIAKIYDMLPEGAGDTSEGRTPADNATVRSGFVIGTGQKGQSELTYPMTSGRNFDEGAAAPRLLPARRQNIRSPPRSTGSGRGCDHRRVGLG